MGIFEALLWLLGEGYVQSDPPMRWLQLPHWVFMRRTKMRRTLTTFSRSHFATKAGTTHFTLSRYHFSTSASRLLWSVPGRPYRRMRLWLNSMGGGWPLSMPASRLFTALPHGWKSPRPASPARPQSTTGVLWYHVTAELHRRDR